MTKQESLPAANVFEIERAGSWQPSEVLPWADFRRLHKWPSATLVSARRAQGGSRPEQSRRLRGVRRVRNGSVPVIPKKCQG